MNLPLSPQESRVLRYAITSLLANYDDMAEDDLEMDEHSATVILGRLYSRIAQAESGLAVTIPEE